MYYFHGVLIDSNLSWEIHIERTCSRNSQGLFIINGLSNMLDMNVRRMLHYYLVYPGLSCGIVWGQIEKALSLAECLPNKKATRQYHERFNRF
jgi:hypothetical protein